ncbi:hypothetical protein [Streptomyces sp. Agncl-13]
MQTVTLNNGVEMPILGFGVHLPMRPLVGLGPTRAVQRRRPPQRHCP